MHAKDCTYLGVKYVHSAESTVLHQGVVRQLDAAPPALLSAACCAILIT